MGAILRKYGVADAVEFPLIVRGGVDFVTGASLATGDVKVIKDGGAAANAANLPAETPAGSRRYQLTLTAAELTAKVVTVVVVDQTDPKAFEDQYLTIETYGDPAAQHPDLAAPTVALDAPERDAVADAVLTRDWTAVSGEPSRCLLQAARFLRNKWQVDGSVLSVMLEDDVTTAWTADLATTPNSAPVTQFDPS